MSEALYPYYERELIFIRQLAGEFARSYPAAAGRLLLEPNRSADPHVERLIESFALLAGRVHHKLDDEFPELTDALLSVLYPHYLAPIPSMGIVQFELDPARAQLPEGFTIGRHSRLAIRSAGGTACRFRTAYPVSLWPVRVADVRFSLPPFPPGLRPPAKAAAVLRLRLECLGHTTFADLGADRLRFYLGGEPQTLATLYEVLFNRALRVEFRTPDDARGAGAIVLDPADCLHQVGFGRDEGLLPYPERSFPGYRLLSEFFAFPSKFLFLDLACLDRARAAGFGRAIEVVVFVGHGTENLEQGVGPDSFRLGCTPVVNLFEQTAEPIPLTQARHEYKIVPDVADADAMEVYSVDSVVRADPGTGTSTAYRPFYSFRHGVAPGEAQTFWYAARRPSLRERDRGTDVYLTLVDLDFDPSAPADSTLVVRTTCTNRDLPLQVRKAGDRVSVELEAAAPLARIRSIQGPTAPLRPPIRRGGYWRLISHLNLNHLSLSGGPEGREALQEILRLYDFADPELGSMAMVNQQIIEGLLSVSSRRVVGRVADEAEGGLCRGVEVAIELDEQKYVGTGAFLFACVLERFLGLYVTINSFSQLVARTKGEGLMRRWPPRAGDQMLL